MTRAFLETRKTAKTPIKTDDSIIIIVLHYCFTYCLCDLILTYGDDYN